ncbi:hypothetical protein PA25_15460 [Pseudoalteromonas sp. A25]|uniref:hypothetical protein n=1 Tax=Pseudoalteromonas sp. A25 TaxID=116092 RepID=UPI0012606514|nr:hypothetical protein [Pseudoalteromonas sp. A25]BBN81561.1 hypothetical protein PA25_15460 [Pseudoalteromonas sp. A25]
MVELYLGLSLLVGLIIIFEANWLLRFPENQITPVTAITSIIEFVWAITTIFALIYGSFTKWQILVPSLYIIHNAIGWIYGLWLAGKLAQQQNRILSIPPWYAKFSLSFGIVFTVLCFIVSFIF